MHQFLSVFDTCIRRCRTFSNKRSPTAHRLSVLKVCFHCSNVQGLSPHHVTDTRCNSRCNSAFILIHDTKNLTHLQHPKETQDFALKCARYAVCACWRWIVKDQFAGEGELGIKRETWGDRTPVYIGRGLIPKMAVLSGRPQVVFVRIGPGLTSNFQNSSGLADLASIAAKNTPKSLTKSGKQRGEHKKCNFSDNT